MLSGLNLAVFSLSRLRLKTAARGGDRQAIRGDTVPGFRIRVFFDQFRNPNTLHR
jgi:hypothetical protein